MKTILLITLIFSSSIAFSKEILCQDQHGIKEFKIVLNNNENEVNSVNNNIYTKIVIKNSNKYSEVDDFAVITDLKSKKTITYSIVCQDV
jgi:hypothetical protein